MRALATLALLTALQVVAAPARAQPAEPRESAPNPPPATPEAAGRRVAVLLLGTGPSEGALASELTEVLIAAVGTREGQQVIGKEEFQARLGQDEARSRQCVESPICLANTGAELAVDEIIAGTIAGRPGGYRLSLTRQEIASGQVMGRFARNVDGDSTALVAAVQQAAVEIYREPERPAELRVDSNVEGAEVFLDERRVGTTPLRLTEIAPGAHSVRVDALGFEAQLRRVRLRSAGHAELDFRLVEAPAERMTRGTPASTLAVVACWTSAGLALSAAALGTVFGLRSQSDFDDDATQREAEQAYDDHDAEALVANISFASAGVLGAFSLYLMLFQSDAVFGESAPAAGRHELALDVGLGRLSVRGRF